MAQTTTSDPSELANELSKLNLTSSEAERVKNLILDLEVDLDGGNKLDEKKLEEIMEDLKVASRTPALAKAIHNKISFRVILLQGMSQKASKKATYAAFALIGNSLVLNGDTRKFLDSEDLQLKLIERFKDSDIMEEFLISRILFLLTYEPTIDYEKIMTTTDLKDTIISKINLHAGRISGKGKSFTDSTDDSALIHTAKLIFNVLNGRSSLAPLLNPGIPGLVSLILQKDQSPPLDEPMGCVINTLLVLDSTSEEWKSSICPKENENVLAQRLVKVFEDSLKAYNKKDYDTKLPAILSALRIIIETTPSSVKEFLKSKLLPSPDDRNFVLGKTDSLPSNLIKLAHEGASSSLGLVASYLLYDLSDNDAANLVSTIGYGNASGILFNLGLPMPEAEQLSSKDSVGEAVNPITGQRISAEAASSIHPELAAMTDEEKEREAEKLFVLFQRLERNGVMNVQNPLRTAMEEGRLEELPDDEEDE